MKIKRIITIIVIAAVICTSIAFFAFRYKSKAAIDVSAANDIAQSLAEGWDKLKNSELPCLDYKMDYTVFDDRGHFIKATRSGLSTDIGSAVRNRDTILDITSNNKILGKLIIYNDTNTMWQKYRNYLLAFSLGIVMFSVLASILFLVYIDKTIFRPFRKLQGFANRVAQGNLELPLEMDRGNLFGAFTESFDLMREELNKARENERLANQSKKELVASLSHDIKTPTASIKAVTEVLLVKSADENQKKQLEIINAKADQINTLISNMFSATMEELQELKVTVTEQSSQVLFDLIRHGDYNHRAGISSIPECIIMLDILRAEQVIDNVISNSYKYADTPVEVSAAIRGSFLELAFQDHGPGVSEEELPLLFNKFYRAGNSAEKSGAGLGLYISKYLMDKMSGEIACEKSQNGFTVTLRFRIA